MKYKVYKNLRSNKYSIKDAQSNMVVGYADVVCMCNCEFKVSEKGRQRVLREKQKNVHAYVVGEIHSVQGFESRNDGEIVLKEVGNECLHKWMERFTYNPYKYETFVDSNGKAVYSADWVVLNKLGGSFV